MKKRILAIISIYCILSCLVTMLFGCSSNENSSTPLDTNTTTENSSTSLDTNAIDESPSTLTDTTYTQGRTETTASENYTIRLCGFSDSVPSVTHQLAYHAWSMPSFVDEKAEKSIHLSVGEISVDAEYEKTEQRFYEFYRTHTYWDKDHHAFSVTESGQLSHYFFGTNLGVDKNEKVCTEAECREIAVTFLGHIVDADDYTVRTVYDTENKQYKFSFDKTVSGLDCADQAEICVEENGHIYSFSSSMLGQIPTDATVNFNVDAVEAQIVTELDEVYAGVKNNYDAIQYEFLYHTVTKDAQGEYMLVVTMDVKCITDNGDVSEMIRERLSFVVNEN